MLRPALLLIFAALLISPAGAFGHGGLPEAQEVILDPSDENRIYVATTFGLLVSSDKGETFHWVCDSAIGYSGSFVPRYAITDDGNLYATTFEGLRVSTDGGCSFQNIGDPLGPDKFVSDVEVGSDGRIWASTSTAIDPDMPNPNDVYVSPDGTTFASAGLVTEDSWWLSLAPAPGIDNAERIYVSGYTPQTQTTPPTPHLYRRLADDGAWEELPTDDFVFGENIQPLIYLLGVSPINPDVVWARAVAANPPLGDAVYVTTDGGLNWTKVLDLADYVQGFVIRDDGSVIIGTFYACAEEDPQLVKGCVKMSPDNGETWTTPAYESRMTCLGEAADGTLYSCGTNWEPDMFALGTSTDDADSWTKIYRFVETAGPLECPAETEQATTCAQDKWPMTCLTLGICAAPPDAGPAATDAGLIDPPDPGGCCRVGGGQPDWPSWLMVCAGLAWMLRRRSSRPVR